MQFAADIKKLIKDTARATPGAQQAKKGWDTGIRQMEISGDYSHTLLKPKYYKDAARGGIEGVEKEGTRASITPHKTPLQFAGLVGARFLTDLGTDSTRRFYWHYNHPMPIADKVAEQIIGPELARDLRPEVLGGSTRFTPTAKAGIRLAGLGLPVGASLGHLDLTNPGEQFRSKGYKQKYADEGSEDRRKTSQIAPELIDRVFLGRRGRPLKYETAKADIPNLTPQQYGNYMRYAYQNKGLTGLGLLKGTMSNLEGQPEVSVVGFPFGLQSGGALAGGSIGLRRGLGKATTARGIAARGGAYALAGGLTGKIANMLIASGNRPKYPSTMEYQQSM